MNISNIFEKIDTSLSDDGETTGGIGMTKPELNTAFGKHTESMDTMNKELNVSETALQNADIFSEFQRQCRRGEELVNESHILDHDAMSARTKGDYALADALQKESFAKKQEGYEILEKLQADNKEISQVSFGGGLGATEIEHLNGSMLVSKGEAKISEGKSLIAKSKKPENANRSSSLRTEGEQLIRDGESLIKKGKKMMKA